MGRFNKGSQKIHCPGCGAKNDASADRCRICTGFMQNEDGSLRGLGNGPEAGWCDESDISIPETTSTIPAADEPEADGEGVSFSAIDDSDGFDMDALEVAVKPQSFPPAQTMAEALPEFDENESVEEPGLLDPSRLRSAQIAAPAEPASSFEETPSDFDEAANHETFAPDPVLDEEAVPRTVEAAEPEPDAATEQPGRLDPSRLGEARSTIFTPDSFERIGFDEEPDSSESKVHQPI